MTNRKMVLILMAFVLAACSPTAAPNPSAYPAETPFSVPTEVGETYPAPGGTGVVEVLPGACDVNKPCEAPTDGAPTPDYLPLPDDKNLTRGNANISDMEVVLSMVEPVQGILQISGELPTPCHQLRADISTPDADKVINVEIYTLVDPNTMCTQVIKPFSKEIKLGVLPAGKYTVKVNGELVGQIMLP